MLNKKIGGGGGAVEMTLMLVHASYSLTKWQAVQLTFFASCKMVDKLAQNFCYRTLNKITWGSGKHWYLLSLRQVYIYT